MPAFAKTCRHRRASRSGIVLVLVLIVVVMIALAGFGFAELMLTENKAAHLNGDELVLDQAIGSGIEFLKSLCQQPLAEQTAAGGLYNNPTAFQNISLVRDDRRTNKPKHQVHFSIVVPRVTNAENLAEMPAEIRYGVENESGKLHLADLLRWDQQKPGAGRLALMRLPGMTDAVADAILDWIDADGTVRELGAENEYYAGQPTPYGPRNGLPECLEELLLVKGVTREMLFGAQPNYNQIEETSPGSRSSASVADSSTPATPWASLLTLYSGYRNVTAEGQMRIDLNAPDLAQLQSQLTAALDPNWAAFIVAYRQFGPVGGPDPGIPAPPPVTPSAPAKFPISSVLDLAGARVSIPGTSPQQPAKIYASPMTEDPQSLGQHLPNLFEKTTTIPLPVVRGGVSVNHAPATVLACVPGIDPALANRIVMSRSTPDSSDESSRRFPTWILSEGLVDLTTMKQLLPNLSPDGDVVRAQVVSHFDDRGPSASVEVVIDATETPARQVFWRDRRFWGTGYTLEELNGDVASAPRAR